MGHAGRHYPNSLRKYRKRSGYSQKKVARILSVSRPQISRWENGLIYPDVINLLKLSILYRTFPNELYADIYLALRGEMNQHYLIVDNIDSENSLE